MVEDLDNASNYVLRVARSRRRPPASAVRGCVHITQFLHCFFVSLHSRVEFSMLPYRAIVTVVDHPADHAVDRERGCL